MSTTTASYDASVALDRKLTPDETRELKILLMPYFHATGDNEASPEDINDLLDYAFAMVNNQKTVEYVIQELVGMEMEFCNSTVAEKVGTELSGFLRKAGNGEDETAKGGKIASLKVCTVAAAPNRVAPNPKLVWDAESLSLRSLILSLASLIPMNL